MNNFLKRINLKCAYFKRLAKQAPLILLTFYLFSSVLTACDKNYNFNSSGSSDNKIVRGPTGGGIGGGIIIVQNNDKALTNTKYDLYIEEDGIKTKIKSGSTDNSGKIYLSDSTLSSDKVKKIQSGSAKIIVEAYDGNTKTVADGKIITKTDSGVDSEASLSA